MNLLTLQICKEEAEKMIKDPHAWGSDFRMSPYCAQKISEQGRRTLEVIKAYENRPRPVHAHDFALGPFKDAGG